MSGGGRIDIWERRAQVICRFDEVEAHAHAVGTLLVGLDGEFELRTDRIPWTRTPAAYLPPGCRHALRVHGERLAVILMAPGTLELRGFARAHGLAAWETHLLPRQDELVAFFNACWNDSISKPDVQALLAGLIGLVYQPAICDDGRVRNMFAMMRLCPEERTSAEAVAQLLGVKGSRARQILREQLGVSWQELRRWERMRSLGCRWGQGHSLTRAAHELGFSDSSQLTRDFRASFGVAPGKLFRKAKVVRHACCRNKDTSASLKL